MATRVSVLTPSLNYSRFLTDAIESVGQQKHVEVEHIIQDGGSTDDTIEVLRTSPEHVLWSSEPDRGQSDALNKALSKATGEWIAWLNADEFYLPEGLRALVETGRDRRADVVHGDTVFVDESGALMRLTSHHPFRASYLRWYGCYFYSCSTVFRREVLADAPWDARYGLAMDWDLYLRLHGSGVKTEYVRYPAGAFRMHGAQVIQRERDYGRDFERLKDDHRVRSRALRQLGRWVHDLDKLLHGAYGPQLCSGAYARRDMRWFASNDAGEGVRAFLDTCYPTR